MEELQDVMKQSNTMTIASHCSCDCEILNKLVLRFLCPNDIETLKHLCDDWFPIKYPDSWYKLIANDERFYSLAAIFEQKIIAILIAEIKPRHQVSKEDYDLLSSSFHNDTKVAYILSLGVHKAYRRQGIASYLLQNFLTSTCTQQKLPHHEVKAIYLHVLSTNTAAIQFYKQNKFKLHHFLPSYYVINGINKDGCSYVLHINGGKPPITCFHYVLNSLHVFTFISFLKLPCRMFIYLANAFGHLKVWPSFSPFISKQRQYRDL